MNSNIFLITIMFISQTTCQKMLPDPYGPMNAPQGPSAISSSYANAVFSNQNVAYKGDPYQLANGKTKAFTQPSQCRRNLDLFPQVDNWSPLQTFLNQSRIIQNTLNYLKSSIAGQKPISNGKRQASTDLFSTIGNVSVPATLCPFATFIQANYSCNASSTIRSYDGSCNNLQNPWYGSINTPYNRFLPAQYQDSIGSPRNTSVTGTPLPNPRLISLALNYPSDTFFNINSLMTYFSQFVVHDVSLIAATPGPDGSPKACMCNTTDPDCINIPSVANFNGNTSIDGAQKCEVTPRSLGVYATMNCTLSPREQVNTLTAWLDLSQCYGISQASSNSLRLFKNGLLKSSFINTNGNGQSPSENLPFAGTADSKTCANTNKACFKGADSRIHVNQLLLGFHTIFVREHNRIARQLAIVNPKMNDNNLFELARRINIANYQNMVYFDWLNVLITRDKSILNNNLLSLTNFNLTTSANSADGYFYGYNPNLYPQIYNEFVTAAFRFGHSMVFSWFSKYNSTMKFVQNVSLTPSILNSSEAYYNGGVDGAIRAALVESATTIDEALTDTLNNNLFLNTSSSLETNRFSLAALNINRNRDHGLPSYTAYLQLLGYPAAQKFSDLTNISIANQQALSKVYANVNDIELWVGGLAETPLPNGILGPTFASIIAKQFQVLKFTDRFYFESGVFNATRFTPAQLNEIRKASVGRLICDNINVSALPSKSIWHTISTVNPLSNCSIYQNPPVNWSVFAV